MPLRPGNAFFDTTDNPHLWIVVAGPDAEGNLILVSLTSVKGRDDRTTVCQAGEHLFIERESVVAYKYATYVEAATVESAVKEGRFQARDDCSPELLEKIAGGLLKSDSTPLGVQNAYVDILRANTA